MRLAVRSGRAALPIGFLLAIGGLLASIAPVAAVASECDAISGNLVTNCGFETGNFSGWTQGGNTGFTGVTASPHTGDFAYFGGPIGSLGSLSQTVTTQAGRWYIFRFFVSGGGSPAHFDAQLTNNAPPATLLTYDDVTLPGWTASSFKFQAATTSATITFNYRNDPAFWFLDDVSVAPVAPPSISKAFNPASISVGGTSALSFTITNQNTVDLTGVAFSDTLPGGVVIATPNGLTGSCGGGTITAFGSSNVSLTGGTVAASSSCTFSVNVKGTSAGNKVNTTSPVTSAEGGTGNSATATLTVLTSDLTISKHHSGTFHRGQTGIYTITVSNLGPGASVGTATVTDSVPSVMPLQSISAPGWTCSVTLNIVTCRRADSLASGASYPAIELTVRPTWYAVGIFINIAQLRYDNDANVGNNAALDPTPIF